MNHQTLRELYVNQLRDIYNSENQVIAALQEMESAAHHDKLKTAFSNHHSETRKQIRRLDNIFETMGENPHGRTCKATEELIKEVKEITASAGDSSVRDAGLIAEALKIELQEVANYGTVAMYAKELGETKAYKSLLKSLAEEKKTRKLLTRLAKYSINKEAVHAYAPIDYNSTDDIFRIATLGILVGFTGGIIAGVLLAPRNSTNIRKYMGTIGNKLSETAIDKTRQLLQQVGKTMILD